MATQLKHRRGNTAQTNAFTGAVAEITVNTDTNRIHVHDGATAGGFPHALTADVAAAVSGLASQSWAQGQFAPIAGNANQGFSVAPGAGAQAAQMQQVQSAVTAAVSGLASQSWAQGQFLGLTGGTVQGMINIKSGDGQNQSSIYSDDAGNDNGPDDCVIRTGANNYCTIFRGDGRVSLAQPASAGNDAPQWSQVQTAIASATSGMATQSWAQGQFLSVQGGTISGLLSIEGNATSGANILLSGNGTNAPNKYLRAYDGLFQIMDSANTNVIFQIDDLGNINYPNSIAIASTIFIEDQNGGNVALYVNSGTYDFVIGSGNPSNRFFLVFSGETGVYTLAANAIGSMDALPLGQAQSLFQPIITQYKVSSLPTGAATGAIAQVTDANNPAWHQTLVGGGSTLCNALFNGTNWIAT